MEEIKSLLQQNLKYIKEVDARVQKIQRYIFWQRIFSIVKVVIIIVPLVLALLYAVPYVNEAFQAYRGVTGTINNLQNGASSISPDLINQFLK